MNRLVQLAFLAVVLGTGAAAARAQRLNVDPAHPYSSSEQKQADKLYKKSLKQQEKAQKKAEKARHKAWKKQQKEADKVNKARQKQIDSQRH